YDAVHIAITYKLAKMKVVRQGLKDHIKKLRFAHMTNHSTHFPSVAAEVAGEEFLMLERFFEHRGPSSRSKEPRYSNFHPFHNTLHHQLSFEQPFFFPLLQCKDTLVYVLRDAGHRLVGFATPRLHSKRTASFNKVLNSLLWRGHYLVRERLDAVSCQNLLSLLSIKFELCCCWIGSED